MKRVLILSGIGLAAAVTQSKWAALALITALMATFVYGIFETTK